MLTHEEDVEIHALRRQGWTISEIARHTRRATGVMLRQDPWSESRRRLLRERPPGSFPSFPRPLQSFLERGPTPERSLTLPTPPAYELGPGHTRRATGVMLRQDSWFESRRRLSRERPKGRSRRFRDPYRFPGRGPTPNARIARDLSCPRAGTSPSETGNPHDPASRPRHGPLAGSRRLLPTSWDQASTTGHRRDAA